VHGERNCIISANQKTGIDCPKKAKRRHDVIDGRVRLERRHDAEADSPMASDITNELPIRATSREGARESPCSTGSELLVE
jgi:hypothetical protein